MIRCYLVPAHPQAGAWAGSGSFCAGHHHVPQMRHSLLFQDFSGSLGGFALLEGRGMEGDGNR